MVRANTNSSARLTYCSEERLHGWISYRDLNVQATPRAVRTLYDQRRHGGLKGPSAVEIVAEKNRSKNARGGHGFFFCVLLRVERCSSLRNLRSAKNLLVLW